MTFCAICASDRGPFELRPLGRDDAIVSVCAACDEQPVAIRTGPDRSYEPSGGLLSHAESTAGIRKALGADYERLSRLDEAVMRAPSEENRHAGDGDFATLRHQHETTRRIRSRRGRR